MGKTLLLVNFGAYLGATDVTLEGGKPAKMSLDDARRQCVSYVAHKQIAPLTVSLGPAKNSEYDLDLVDTPGMVDGISRDPKVRHAMGQGLEAMFRAQVILVVLDGGEQTVTPLDDSLVGLANQIAPTIIVDNKADGPRGVRHGAHREHFSDHAVLAVSALTRRGFRELKQRLYSLRQPDG